MRFVGLFLTAFILNFGVSFAQSAEDEQPSSVVETYRDWTVRCVPQGKSRTCQLVQELAQGKSGQRVLSFVLDVPKKDSKTVSATVLAPFGLKLSEGVLLTVDGVKNDNAFKFSTCIPLGCIVPISLDEAMIEKMQSGGKLGVSMVSISTGKRVNVELSLKGFTAAFKRLRTL